MMFNVIMEKIKQKTEIQCVPIWEVTVKQGDQRQPHWGHFSKDMKEVSTQVNMGN